MINTYIIIDRHKCVGCGLCARDCSRSAIDFDREKAKVDVILCNECGHCVAICPCNAVTLYGEACKCVDVVPSIPDAEAFLDFLKFRRSTRHYKKQEIEPEKLDMIIEAGRYSPTAGNRQQNRFIILKEKVEQVREASIKVLKDVGENNAIDLGAREIYRKSWARMYDDYAAGRCDRLFFNAPAVILIVSDESNHYAGIDGGIAASRMEIQANALGLGVCYIGFLNTAMEFDGRIKELAGLKEGEKLAVAFVTGYPDVEYQRPASRKPANVRKL